MIQFTEPFADGTQKRARIFESACGLTVLVETIQRSVPPRLRLTLWRDDRLPDAADVAAAFAAFVPPERQAALRRRSAGRLRPTVLIWEERA